MTKTWLPLEANPDVLTRYARSLGMSDRWAFYDVLSVEPWAVKILPQPVRAILLLFPISPMSEEERRACPTDHSTDAYFMKQTVGNACGTIAVLHTLLNHAPDDVQNIGTTYISRMHHETKDLSAAERGSWLENDTEIEKAHLSMESQGQSALPQAEDIDTHFIAFIRSGNTVVELDGRREGPVIRGEVAGESDFASNVLDVIKREFMDRNPEDVRFSILALAPADQS
jgi:ubiquitin carboxyl-terminal hydrolase L3